MLCRYEFIVGFNECWGKNLLILLIRMLEGKSFVDFNFKKLYFVIK